MNVLSLFDGMSCGQIALQNIGAEVSNYYASEIDPYAIKIAQKNFPETVQLGDVTEWREWPIDWASIDLLIGGSPCQGFSFAGKQLAFEDPRSVLFFTYVEILTHIKSVNPGAHFLLENVKMKQKELDVISESLSVPPILINSGLVSAQNRERYYWSSLELRQPLDEGLVLGDIIEEGSRSYLSESTANRVRTIKNLRRMDQKSGCLLATGYKLAQANGMTVIDDAGGRRCMSPLEWERAQTVPDNYTEGVSNTQRYKMLGNGWTVRVLEGLLQHFAGL